MIFYLCSKQGQTVVDIDVF